MKDYILSQHVGKLPHVYAHIKAVFVLNEVMFGSCLCAMAMTVISGFCFSEK